MPMEYQLAYMDEYEDYHTTYISTFNDKDTAISAFDRWIIEAGDQPAGSWLELWEVDTYDTIKEYNY
jgi:hypothetical protein